MMKNENVLLSVEFLCPISDSPKMRIEANDLPPGILGISSSRKLLCHVAHHITAHVIDRRGL